MVRDPDGVLIRLGGRFVRVVRAQAATQLAEVLTSRLYHDLRNEGRVVATEEVPAASLSETIRRRTDLASRRFGESRVFEHEVVPFPSYPYEWPAEMLRAAADLHLDISERALAAGLGLKDATPFNVLFRGPQPVFVDVLSLETRSAGDPVWLPYAQFARMFVLPLVMLRRFHLEPRQVFGYSGHGVAPEQVVRMSSALTRLTRVVLTHATVPHLLRSRADRMRELARPRRVSPGQAEFVLTAMFRRLRKDVALAGAPSRATSAWSAYSEEAHTSRYHEAKAGIVEQALIEFAPRKVLDIGRNTGRHAMIAARHGASVVAIDSDPHVVGQLWATASRAKADVLPLVVDITNPSPAAGWRGNEWTSFLQRSYGQFDCVLMLGLLHHIRTEGVPIEAVLDLLSELTSRTILLEWVPRSDAMFRRIAKHRLGLYADVDTAAFKAVVLQRFETVRCMPIPGSDRAVYVLRKR